MTKPTHPYWLRAGERNIQETSDHGASRFDPSGRKRKQRREDRVTVAFFLIMLILAVLLQACTTTIPQNPQEIEHDRPTG